MRERIRFERELSDLGLAEFEAGKAAPIVKNVVLAAGFDYQFSGAEFSRMCDRRMKQLVKRHPKLKLKFTIFDVGKGTVKTKEMNSRGKITETLIKSFDAVSSANYDMTAAKKEKDFTSGANVMSILDIYKHIQDLGKTESGSLLEFSIFSHGWDGGPILVNGDSSQPDDKDGRIAHFSSATRVSELKAAFDRDGVYWLWGCNFVKIFLIIFSRLRDNKKKKYKPVGLKDSDVFELGFSESKRQTAEAQTAEKLIYTDIWDILGGTGNPPTNRNSLIEFTKTIKFEDLKNAFILRGLDETFAQKAGLALGIRVIAALPGTYSDYEKDGHKLMLVPRRRPPYSDNFSGIIEFYKNYSGIETDSEKLRSGKDRGYGKYPY